MSKSSKDKVFQEESHPDVGISQMTVKKLPRGLKMITPVFLI